MIQSKGKQYKFFLELKLHVFYDSKMGVFGFSIHVQLHDKLQNINNVTIIKVVWNIFILWRISDRNKQYINKIDYDF